ncbi:hypothetical protein Tco_0804660 [Tanacetum coccineum]|uniref:Uncharacterized protein n=1 Tax=Tanacetum coccineum TaxID=301880 RepID=A0ABQ5A953_9ASTR
MAGNSFSKSLKKSKSSKQLIVGSEMGLFDFIKSSYPFKVNVGERTLVDGEVSLLKETEDRVIPPLAEVAFDSSLPHVKKSKTNPSATLPRKKKNPSNEWKTRATLQRLVTLDTLQENIGFGSAVAVVDAFVSESATPSPNHEYKDESDSVQDGDASSSLKYVSNPPPTRTEAMLNASALVHEACTSSAAPGNASPVDRLCKGKGHIEEVVQGKDGEIVDLRARLEKFEGDPLWSRVRA